jgi:hypothetical protein
VLFTYEHMTSDTNLLTIGSDPELAFFNPYDHSPVPAHKYLIDNILNRPFGYDGHTETGEIRPNPERDPLLHAENIKNILFGKCGLGSNHSIYSLLFYSSSLNLSIGGHIHFGHPLFLIDKNKLIETIYGLDSLLSFPLMFLEIPQHAIRRKLRYGGLSSYRTDKLYGFEYRTPPSWLATKELTEGTLCLSYAIVHEYLKKDFKLKNPLTNEPGFKENFIIHNTDYLYKYLKNVLPIIKGMELYSTYKDHIDYVLYHAENQNHIMNIEIKKGWKIPFTVIGDIAVLTAREFIDKMTKSIVEKNNISIKSYRDFIIYKSQDFQIPQIAYNINYSLHKIITEHKMFTNFTEGSMRINRIYIFARKRSSGPGFTININKKNLNNFYPIKIKRLKKILLYVIRSFGDTKIKINLSLKEDIFKYEYFNKINHSSLNHFCPHPYSNYSPTYNYATIISTEGISEIFHPQVGYSVRIGIPRSVRERKDYMAEAVLLIVLLYINKSLYQSKRFDHVTGKKRTIPLIQKTLIKQIKDNMTHSQKDIPIDYAMNFPEEAETGEEE